MEKRRTGWMRWSKVAIYYQLKHGNCFEFADGSEKSFSFRKQERL